MTLFSRYLIPCLCCVFGLPGKAQDIKQTLAGASQRTWSENYIEVDEDGDWADSEEEFDMDEELIKYIPQHIVFQSNGTCELVYQKELYEDIYTTVTGRWQLRERSIFITQNDGRSWSMKVLSIEQDDYPLDDEYYMECTVNIRGLRVGVNSVTFKWSNDSDEEDGN